MDYPLPIARHPGAIFLHKFMLPEDEKGGWLAGGLGPIPCVAVKMGVTSSRLRRFIDGQDDVNPALAKLLAAVTETAPEYWIQLQEWYDEEHPARKEPVIRIGHRAVPIDEIPNSF